EAHRELVNLLVSTARSDEASRARRQEIEIYQEAQTRLPNDSWLHKERARALSQLSEILESLERFEDAARARGEEFSEREWISAALENDIYRKDVVEVRIYLARSYKSAGDWEKALAEFSKAIEQAAQRWDLWWMRGTVQARLKRWDGALADFGKAIELAPPDRGELAWTYFDRANAYVALHDEGKALADLTTAVDRWPELFDVWAWRGWFHRDWQRWDEAAADFSKALELNPSFWQVWFDRAVVQIKLEKPDQAVADLREAVRHGLKD